MRRQLFLIIALLCAVAQGAWAQTWTEVSTADALKTAVQTDGANIKLTADIELSSYLNINNSRTITIDLAGHTLSRNLTSAGMNGHVIWIKSGTLYIKDSSDDPETPEYDGSGKLSGGQAHNGGGIYNSGTLYFQGGTITGCRGSLTAGGIRNNGTVYFEGGVITNCSGTDGGGIYNQGTLTISGGEIKSNTSSTYGGGVYSHGSSKLTITGGSITNNTATYGGGGIDSNCNINMSGSVTITGNTVNGSANNIYMGGASTVINVTGTLASSNNKIGITLENNDRDFTSGFKANSGSTDPSEFFSSDVSDVSLTLNGEEAYMSITSGLTYIQRSWEGGLITGKVASCTKYLSNGKYNEYNGQSEISDDGWYLLSGTHTYNNRLTIKGGAKFVLQDGCDIEFTKGIYIEQDKTLTIYGQSNDSGKLRATGSGDDANGAIGGNEGSMGGYLDIHGGTVEASSSENNAAAIGGGNGSSSGMQKVTIRGGTVTATGKSSGAGIGGGQENSTAPSVIIYGGTVTATGGNYAAGIGGGERGTNGSVVIYSGTVRATGGFDGAGIGGGEDADAGSITIYNGKVNATGGSNGAGIGGGDSGNGGTVTIYGGTVNATSGSNGSGIGGGKNGYGGTVTIYNGNVTATGVKRGIGIGGNYKATVNIHGGTVKAHGNYYNKTGGIGIGVDGDGTLYFNMTGGNVTADIQDGGSESENGNDEDSGAGIGGGKSGNVTLYITIDGGTVNATGAYGGAGIGAGSYTYSGGGGDIKSGSTITINGGTVNATGGIRGAGIGAGHGGNNKGTITINGGTVKATGGKYAAGIGCGEEETIGDGGNAGTIIINGGKVTVEVKDESGSSQAIGYGENGDDSGTLTIADNLCVKNGDGSITYGSGDREPRCRDHAKRIIEECEHSGKCTDNNDGSTHAVNCTYCLTSGNESHTYGSDGHTCTRCSYEIPDLKTITIYEANSDGTGYGTATTHTVQYGKTYTLPDCSSVPENMWFAGWKETTTQPAGIEVESSELSTLTAAGTEITVTTDVTYYARYHTTIWPGGGNGTAGDPYLISTEEDWNELANAVSEKNFDFYGRYLKMTADISVTEMVGTSSNRFRGNFDGDGHTLTVNYDTSEQYTAPFRFVGSATIKNLNVSGNISTSAKFASGLIGGSNGSNGNVTNCRSSVAISSTVNGDGTHGGFVANITSGSVNIKGCIFDGTMTGSSTNNCGGFVGWVSGTAANLTDCLFMPASIGLNTSGCCTFSRRSDYASISNCFYTEALGTAQGTKAYTVESDTEGLTLDYGSGNNYGSITAYSFDQGNDQTASGLLYSGKLYTGGSTKVTFTPKTNNGQQPALSTTGGSLAGNSDGTYTLTMNNANATVTATSYSNYDVTLYDGSTNTETISSNRDRIADVTISGRTLYKDDSWNTFCVPFDVEDGDDEDDKTFSGTPLEGATVKELSVNDKWSMVNGQWSIDNENGTHQTGFDASTSTLYLYFKDATKIKAGRPYLVKWGGNTSFTSPTFTSAEIEGGSPRTVTSDDGKVSFLGNYDPVDLPGGDASNLYLGAGNKLYWPSAARTIKSFRAYFQLHGITAGEPTSGSNGIRAFSLHFGDDSEQTGITTTNYTNFTNSDNSWYSLDGRKLSGKPTAKGIYIYNGKKRVIK